MSMNRITRSGLRDGSVVPTNVTVGPLHPMPERVLQFGEGNFLRAFVDWQLNVLARRGKLEAGVVVVQPLRNGMVGELNAQGGVYTHLQRGLVGTNPVDHREIITVIQRGIDPYADWKGFLATARNPDMRWVVSNTTEAGIAYVDTPQPVDAAPLSYPAKLAWWLRERFHTFGGTAESGVVVLPCELIERNGAELRACVLRHARDWGTGPDVEGWIGRSVVFCNTLVDRIVPGYPAAEAARISSDVGYLDPMMTASEFFHLWVIEGAGELKRELPLADAGLNVKWVDDLTPYRTLKVRILNGLHTLFTIPALLSGLRTVGESLDDPAMGRMIAEGLAEILPTLDASREDRESYAREVLSRFKNPYIVHQLSSIALNSASKFAVRVLPSLLRSAEMRREIPPVMALSFAALIEFFRGADPDIDRSGWVHPVTLPPAKEEPRVLSSFHVIHSDPSRDAVAVVSDALGLSEVWGADLRTVPGLVEATARSYELLRTKGVIVALNAAVRSAISAPHDENYR
jgi:tagaturonate reductase